MNIGIGDLCNCLNPSAIEAANPLCAIYCGSSQVGQLVSPPVMTNPPNVLLPPPAPQTETGMTQTGVWTPEVQAEVLAQRTQQAQQDISGGAAPTGNVPVSAPTWCDWVPFSSYFSKSCPSGVGTTQVLVLVLAGVALFAFAQGAVRR